MARNVRSMSACVVAQEETLMRMAARPCQRCRRTSRCRLPGWRRSRGGSVVVAEGDEDLVEDDLVQDFEARGAQPVGEARGVATVALDQVGEPARPSERSAAQTSTPRARRDTSGV